MLRRSLNGGNVPLQFRLPKRTLVRAAATGIACFHNTWRPLQSLSLRVHELHADSEQPILLQVDDAYHGVSAQTYWTTQSHQA